MAVTEQVLVNARVQLLEFQNALDRAISDITTLEHRQDEISANLNQIDDDMTALRRTEGEVSDQIQLVLASIGPAETELETLEVEQAHLLAKESESRPALNSAEHHHAQARINLARRQESLDALRRRIEDDFGLVAFEYADEVSGPTPLPLEGMVEQLPQVRSLTAEFEETLKRQRAQLRRMGPINPEAQAEYREVQDRFQFLTDQIADLSKAEADIRKVIAELDTLMQHEFHQTFNAVAAEFHQIFNRLFNGGSARLILTDPDDLSTSGIDIEARLPGRREQGLSLLSGGERSLTAIALVFALLMVSPTPFCVLDEVDAMLDETNVGRFNELLQELSRKTQFIIITHNRNTVEAADIIYGVTMGRDSASQVISLKLDEVDERFQERA